MSDTELKENVRPVLNIEPPKDYKIIYLNDDVTTYEFVIESLTNIFEYDEEGAEHIVMQLRKVVSTRGTKEVEFADGKKQKLGSTPQASFMLAKKALEIFRGGS